jgi:hypothetical protein
MLGPWQGVIDTILERRQARTDVITNEAAAHGEADLGAAKRRGGLYGGNTIVKDYVRLSKIGSQEMFVPLRHAPGEAQAGISVKRC